MYVPYPYVVHIHSKDNVLPFFPYKIMHRFCVEQQQCYNIKAPVGLTFGFGAISGTKWKNSISSIKEFEKEITLQGEISGRWIRVCAVDSTGNFWVRYLSVKGMR